MGGTTAASAHGGLMDAVYRNQRHIYDLTRKYYLLGRDRLIAELDAPDGANVLEVACGTGRNLVLAARRYPHARFFGFDISAEMLKQAHRNVEKAGLSDRIVLAQGDATDFDSQALFGVSGFERTFVSYSLSMIPPWHDAVTEAMTHLSAGGSLHVVDFGQQERLPRWFAAGLNAWLAKFHVEPRADLEAVLAAAAGEAGAGFEFRSLYRDYARYGVVRRRSS
ncbi:class I SAM-dependent methyltransferase [Oricola sp.]|uniref:class I SAM-dependent methyltransferase n=1 Tax=Oricola sp. TaxID=1979950 RepID=UPI0025F48166|nr:class I SAM-dependent methyltransferase [Oricola sp.]MCI5076227.1 class I SAM-dependent methyltransferase [Oricola sp.]